MREGWEYKSLDQIATIEYGTRVVQKIDGGSIYPVYGGGGATFRMDRYNRENRMVIARFAISKQCTRYVDGKFFLNDSGLTVSSNSKELSQTYLDRCLMGYNDKIYSLGKGAAQKNLEMKAFTQLIIPVPPLTTQQSIVTELDTLSAIIADHKAQLKDYDALEQSIFYDMFGDPVKNEKGWDVKKLGECCSFKNGLNFSKSDTGTPYKFLGVSDFQDKKEIYANELDSVCIEDEISAEYFLKDGDIVFVRSNGSKALVGRNVLIHLQDEKVVFSGFCIRARLHEHNFMPLFVLHILKSDGIKCLISNSGRGCNISNLNQKILDSIDIFLPPLALQQTFASKIAAIEQMKSETKKALQEAETLFQARMDYWFN